MDVRNEKVFIKIFLWWNKNSPSCFCFFSPVQAPHNKDDGSCRTQYFLCKHTKGEQKRRMLTGVIFLIFNNTSEFFSCLTKWKKMMVETRGLYIPLDSHLLFNKTIIKILSRLVWIFFIRFYTVPLKLWEMLETSFKNKLFSGPIASFFMIFSLAKNYSLMNKYSMEE